MNKHFLRTMKRVLRDLESLEERAANFEYSNTYTHIVTARRQIADAVNYSNYDETPASLMAPKRTTPAASPTEQPADTTMHTHFEQLEQTQEPQNHRAQWEI